MPGFLTVIQKKYTVFHCPLTVDKLNLQFFLLWAFLPPGRVQDIQALISEADNGVSHSLNTH